MTNFMKRFFFSSVLVLTCFTLVLSAKHSSSSSSSSSTKSNSKHHHKHHHKKHHSHHHKKHHHNSKHSSHHHKKIHGHWTPLNNQPKFGEEETLPGAMTPLLLTDGSVMVVNDNTPYTGEVWKLTPDHQGSYVNGTWSPLASLPEGYRPLYFSSAVLADGRVIFEGGEYNGPNYKLTYTNKGAIYDPVANTWTVVTPPPFFKSQNPKFPGNVIGNAANVVLENGTFMLACALSYQTALLDSTTMTWTESGSTYPYSNAEQGWTLLPNGKVFTKNAYADSADGLSQYPADATTSQIYDPKTDTWASAGSSIVPLNDALFPKMGPAVLRADGKVFVVGTNGNTALYNSTKQTWEVGPKLPKVQGPKSVLIIDSPVGIKGEYLVKLATQKVSQSFFSVTGPIVRTIPPGADTTVTNNLTGKIALIATDDYTTGSINKGNNAAAAGAIACIFYNSTGVDSTNISGSTLIPSVVVDYETGQKLISNLDGLIGTLEFKHGEVTLGSPGGCGALLPNGNVLFAASPNGNATFSNGLYMLEFNGEKIIQQPTVPNAPYIPCLNGMMVVLPTGQVLMTDLSSDVQIYTPVNNTPKHDWKPVIRSVRKEVHKGSTYKISGIRFNGMAQGSNCAASYQSATNYPLVRITNLKTKQVVYCRTHDHSFMGVASDKRMHTLFDVPHHIHKGKSKIEVVANGIASKGRYIFVK